MMKTSIGRKIFAFAAATAAVIGLNACASPAPPVSSSHDTAARNEALNMNPPPSMPTQQPTLVWVPGHYDARGAWVPGRWRKI